MQRQKVNHSRFDRLNIEVLIEPGQDYPKLAYQAQGRAVLELLSLAAQNSNSRVLTGEQVREVLERNRRAYFASSKQAQIIRIFQEYRARFVRAGLIRVWKSPRVSKGSSPSMARRSKRVE